MILCLLGKIKSLLGIPTKSIDTLGPKEPHTQQDIIDYYKYAQAANNDPSAQTLLGHVYYFGTGDMAPSFEQAREHFERASKAGSSVAASLLGLLWMRGEGVPGVNYRKAYTYFRQGMRQNNPIAINGMGMLYWKGWDVLQDKQEALKLFKRASNHGFADAFYNTAMVLAEIDPIGNADGTFQNLLAAVQSGYALANYEIVKRFLRSQGTCHLSVFLLQQFINRVDIPRMFEHALKAYASHDFDAATTRYIYLAQQGFATAQHNAAFILEHHGDTEQERDIRALIQWNRAALQGDIMARVRVGDIYYRRGMYLAAASAYHTAATSNNLLPKSGNSSSAISDALGEQKRTAPAIPLFNLAYMYHRGIGLEQDKWMAARYYHAAMQAHSAAWLPVKVCLLLLNIQSNLSTYDGYKIWIALGVSGVIGLVTLWKLWKVLEQVNQRRPSIPVALVNEDAQQRERTLVGEQFEGQPQSATPPVIQAEEASTRTQPSTSTSDDLRGGEDEPLLVNLQNEGE